MDQLMSERDSRQQDASVASAIDDWEFAISRTFEVHKQGLTAAAARLCGRIEAPDVVQQAYLRIWANAANFDHSRGSLTHYLYMVVRSTAIDRARWMASSRARDVNDLLRREQLCDEPDTNVLRLERQQLVRDALDLLRPAEREAIVFAFYQQLTYKAIALRLNIPEGTVKSRIRIGLTRLRCELAAADMR